ncbi:hypothetical protein IIC65_08880 [Candidatus Sumerlaeota bacterium]|nr:hypothetical protein [Candidatus Sumerlaeota bacterium]
MTASPNLPIYLFYGNQVDAILASRDRTLDSLLGKENRNQNLTEYGPSGSRRNVEFFKVLPEIAADLAMTSFVPGADKVAVVTNPDELYSRGGGGSGTRSRPKRAPKRSTRSAAKKTGVKKTAAATAGAMKWLETTLPQTSNHIILVALEDEAAGHEINEKHPLFQLIARIGTTHRFRDTKAFFRIEDALLQRRPADCLKAVRDLWKPGKGDQAVYSAIVRTLRFMLQANIARDRGAAGDPAKLELYFPARAQFNLFKTGDFVRGKYTRRRIPYRTTALLQAYERMLEVYRALRPRPGDLFVPDARALLERIIFELFASPQI